MKRKRLTRDKWGFQGFPYYQLRVDYGEFHGTIALIKLTDGDYYYWNTPKAGKFAVCGAGMTWLQFIPDGKHRVVTVKFLEKDADNKHDISVWYVDVIERTETDGDGVIVFIDKYLDVIFTPQGDVVIDDRDELDAAYVGGELTKAQYEEAIAEGEDIKNELCSDIANTERKYKELLDNTLDRIDKGDYDFCICPLTKILFVNSELTRNPDISQLIDKTVSKTGAVTVEFDSNGNIQKDITEFNGDKDKSIRKYLNKRRDVDGFAILDIDTCGYNSDTEIKEKVFTPDNPDGITEVINTFYYKKNFKR